MAALSAAAVGLVVLAACAQAGKLSDLPPQDADVLGADAGSPAAAEAAAPARDAGLETDAAEVDVDAGVDAEADAAPACPTSPCAIFPACGCGASATCDLAQDGGRECVMAGSAPAGKGCLSTTSCAPGLLCIGGACRAPCDTAGAACSDADAGACTAYAATQTDAGTSGPARLGCAVPCELADPASCGYAAGDRIASGCVFTPATGRPDCVRVSSFLNSLCTTELDCVPGQTCVDYAGARVCRKVCKVGDPNACGGCNAGLLPAPVVVGGVQYGTCP